MPLQSELTTSSFSVKWPVAKTTPPKGVKFCVTAVDPTGNKSDPTCVGVVVRKI